MKNNEKHKRKHFYDERKININIKIKDAIFITDFPR